MPKAWIRILDSVRLLICSVAFLLRCYRIVVVVVVSSPHQSPRCGAWRVEKVWKFWLPTVSVGDPASKRQLPFGSLPHRSVGRSNFDRVLHNLVMLIQKTT